MRISYAEFDGYNKVLRNIDSISQSIRLAAQKSKDGSISRGKKKKKKKKPKSFIIVGFALAAKRVTGIGLVKKLFFFF